MNVILSRDPELSFLKKRKIKTQYGVILHLILPEHPRALKKVKRLLRRCRAESLLPEENVPSSYTEELGKQYRIVDGSERMLRETDRALGRLLAMYGFQKGKVRAEVVGAQLPAQVVSFLHRYQEYWELVIFTGQRTAEKEQAAHSLYEELGINTIFKKNLGEARSHIVLLTDDSTSVYKGDAAFLWNIRGKHIRTETPIFRDCRLALPPEMTGFFCRDTAIGELLKQDFPVLGFQKAR